MAMYRVHDHITILEQVIQRDLLVIYFYSPSQNGISVVLLRVSSKFSREDIQNCPIKPPLDCDALN